MLIFKMTFEMVLALERLYEAVLKSAWEASLVLVDLPMSHQIFQKAERFAAPRFFTTMVCVDLIVWITTIVSFGRFMLSA
jgi:hypothetical protein